MRLVIALGVALTAQGANAQFKCTGADGKVAFQQTPCDDRQRQEAIKLRDGLQPAAPRPRASDAAASSPTGMAQAATQPRPTESPYTRLNEMLVRERRTAELEREIQSTEAAIDYRNNQLNAEIAALQAKKHQARNNLAGATWEQSISIEMQAVATKYKTQNDNDHERLKKLRADLETVKRAPGK